MCLGLVSLSSFNSQVKVREQDVTFALKVIKKKHVVDNRQEEHIHSERKILAEARSPFVVKSVLFSLSNIPQFSPLVGGKPMLRIEFLFDHSWGPWADYIDSLGHHFRSISRAMKMCAFFSLITDEILRQCSVSITLSWITAIQFAEESDIKVIFHHNTLLPLTCRHVLRNKSSIYVLSFFFHCEVALCLGVASSFASFTSGYIARLKTTNMCTCCWRPAWGEKFGVCSETGKAAAALITL